MRCALEADIRWDPRAAHRAHDSRRTATGAGQLGPSRTGRGRLPLLNPMAHDRNGVPRANALRASKTDIAAAEAELSKQRKTDATAARSAWSQRFPDFKESLAARLTVVEEEGRDAVALATEELRRAGEALEVARERGNQAQITRAENARNAATDKVRMARAFWDERARWLRECEEQVRLVRPREQLTALMRTRKVS